MKKSTELFDHGITADLIMEMSQFIGLIVIQCIFIEQAISAIFEITADDVHFSGRKVKRPDAFDDKIKLCGKIFRQVETLKIYNTDVDVNLKKLKFLKSVRDTFAHGAINSYEAKTKKFTFSTVNPGSDNHIIRETVISLETIMAAASEASRLVLYFQKLAHDLMDRND